MKSTDYIYKGYKITIYKNKDEDKWSSYLSKDGNTVHEICNVSSISTIDFMSKKLIDTIQGE